MLTSGSGSLKKSDPVDPGFWNVWKAQMAKLCNCLSPLFLLLHMCLASGNRGNQSDGKYDKSCQVYQCQNSPTGEDFVQPFEGTKDPAFIFVEPPDLEVKKERKNFKDIRSQKHINLKLAKMLVDSYPSPKVLLSTWKKVWKLHFHQKYHILPVANPKDVIQVGQLCQIPHNVNHHSPS